MLVSFSIFSASLSFVLCLKTLISYEVRNSKFLQWMRLEQRVLKIPAEIVSKVQAIQVAQRHIHLSHSLIEQSLVSRILRQMLAPAAVSISSIPVEFFSTHL